MGEQNIIQLILLIFIPCFLLYTSFIFCFAHRRGFKEGFDFMKNFYENQIEREKEDEE